jgi:hypothetical protein
MTMLGRLIALMLVLGMGLAGTPLSFARAVGSQYASLDASGSITGQISVNGGSPIPDPRGIILSLGQYRNGGNQLAIVQEIHLAEGDTSFAFSDLNDGDYLLRVFDSYARYGQWFHAGAKGWRTATPIPVRDGASVQVKADLLLAGNVSGEIRTDSGLPLDSTSRFTVRIRSADPEIEDVRGQRIPLGQGRFSIPVLQAGSWYVEVEDEAGNYAKSVFGSVSGSSGTPIQIGPGERLTGVDITVGLAGKVSGKVTGCDPGVSGSCLCVAAYLVAAERVSGSACAFAPGGEFVIGGLAPGQYHVAFGTGGVGGFWYPYALDRASAMPVTVEASKVTQLEDRQKRPTFGVSGVLEFPESRPLLPTDAFCVYLYPLGSTAARHETCSDTGSREFAVPDVPIGRYQLLIQSVDRIRFQPTWYPGYPDRGRASEVIVNAPIKGLLVNLVMGGTATDLPPSGPTSGLRLASRKEEKRASSLPVLQPLNSSWTIAPVKVIRRGTPIRLDIKNLSHTPETRLVVLVGDRQLNLRGKFLTGSASIRALVGLSPGVYPVVFRPSEIGVATYLRLIVR